MVSLSMVVLGESRYRSPQGRLAAQNQLRQAFLSYRSHPSLRECVQIRTPRRQPQRLHSPGLQYLAERFAELGVPIMQQISAGVQTSQFLQRRVSSHLLHRHSVGMIRDSSDRYPLVAQMNEEQHIIG